MRIENAGGLRTGLYIITGGGTHILRHTGMFCSNWLLFLKKSLNMGSIFYKNISKHGSFFPKFSGVRQLISQEKFLKMGAFFCQNNP